MRQSGKTEMVILEHAEPYTLFASCYDRMMRHVDYRAWAQFVFRQVRALGIEGGRVVDLACGTGVFLSHFIPYGFCGEGVDLSEAMLEKAAARMRSCGLECAFSRQDMRCFRVDVPADVVVCLHDSFNYLQTFEELVCTLRSIEEALRPGGVAVFDVSTRYNIRKNFSGRVFSEETPEYSFIWKNRYNPFTALATVDIEFLIKDGVATLPARERHFQRIHGRRVIRKAIRMTEGLELVAEYGGVEERRVTRRSICLSYILRKKPL